MMFHTNILYLKGTLTFQTFGHNFSKGEVNWTHFGIIVVRRFDIESTITREFPFVIVSRSNKFGKRDGDYLIDPFRGNQKLELGYIPTMSVNDISPPPMGCIVKNVHPINPKERRITHLMMKSKGSVNTITNFDH